MNMGQTVISEADWRRYEQARPRSEMKISPSLLKDYAGHYRLDDNFVVTIEPGGNSISLTVTGQSGVNLVPEAPDKFFSKEIPLQATFDRDAKGSVSHLVVHQNGKQHMAGRTSASEAKAAARAFSARLARQEPFPESEAMIRELIAGARAGSIGKAKMTPKLSEVLEDQEATIRRDIVKAGSLRSLSFKGVGPDGWDVYDAVFAHGQQQWRIHIDRQGMVSGLWIKPGP
jgi:hypothetical protein